MSVLPIPSSLGKLITQGSLPVALLIMLTVNRRIIIRPNVFLCLVSLLVFEAILTCLEAQYLKGTVYRTFRLAEFVAALWLFTPFWGRRDLLLARCHLKAMAVVLGSVVLGLLVAPGHARNSGRLQGAIWPIPSTQVAHYAAVTLGLVTVLWFCGYMRGRLTAFAVVVSGAILILTHTRTALVGLIVGSADRRPEPDRGQGAGPQAVRRRRRGRGPSGPGIFRPHHDLAGARPGYARS